MYKLTSQPGTIIRIADGANIPADQRNADYIEYLAWVAAGNTPLPVPAPTADEQRAIIQAQIDTLERTAIENRKWREYSVGEMEKTAIAYGAAQVPPLDAATSLAYAYATNIAYKKTKDLDVQITALRTQKDAII